MKRIKQISVLVCLKIEYVCGKSVLVDVKFKMHIA